ncbi:MAG TPA: hypothetical protein PLP31_13460 [Thermoanaerobaculaceae bacterium]|nr:hypothetical protein [Thermoanaerobaculaceae bacterium]
MGFFFSHTCTCCGFRMASSGPDEVYQTTDGVLHRHPEAFDCADLPGTWGLEVFGYCSTCRRGVRAVALDPGTDGWVQSVLGRADVDHVSFTCRDCREPVLYRLEDLLWLPCPQCGTANLVTRLEGIS